MQRLAEEPRGLVLVTGPTGSGKTTTIASMIDHINETRAVNIVTIEDPIEVLHTDKRAIINQREIGTDTDGFAQAMRRVLRQDPDVIFIGEMRDPETVWAALSAAETGHLVLSTLHTANTVETVNRIVDFFPPHQHKQIRLSLATSLRGVCSQRLLERADGKGRIPAVEVLVNTGRVFDRIVDPDVPGDSIEEIIADGEYYGMQTFDQSLFALYRDGLVEPAGRHGGGLEPPRLPHRPADRRPLRRRTEHPPSRPGRREGAPLPWRAWSPSASAGVLDRGAPAAPSASPPPGHRLYLVGGSVRDLLLGPRRRPTSTST